LNESVTISKQI